MKDSHSVVATGMQKVSVLLVLQSCYVNKLPHFPQWPGRIFKVPTPTGWNVVITDPTHIDDIKKAPGHILSARKVIEEVRYNHFVVLFTLKTALSIRTYKRNTILIAMRERTKSTTQSSRHDSEKNLKHWGWSEMFTMRWSNPAINIFLSKMVCFGYSQFTERDDSSQNG